MVTLCVASAAGTRINRLNLPSTTLSCCTKCTTSRAPSAWLDTLRFTGEEAPRLVKPQGW